MIWSETEKPQQLPKQLHLVVVSTNPAAFATPQGHHFGESKLQSPASFRKQKECGKLSKTLKRLTNLSKDVPEFLGLIFFVGFMETRLNCGNPAISITMWGIPHPFAICHSLWGSKLNFLVGHAIGNHSTPGLVSLYTDNA